MDPFKAKAFSSYLFEVSQRIDRLSNNLFGANSINFRVIIDMANVSRATINQLIMADMPIIDKLVVGQIIGSAITGNLATDDKVVADGKNIISARSNI